LFEAFVAEFPPTTLFTCRGILEAQRVRLDFAESVEIELTDKAGEIVVFKEFWTVRTVKK